MRFRVSLDSIAKCIYDCYTEKACVVSHCYSCLNSSILFMHFANNE